MNYEKRVKISHSYLFLFYISILLAQKMSRESKTINDFISWNPPDSCRVVWAEHLHEILKKNNHGAPIGWLRDILMLAEENKQFAPSEKDLVVHLHDILPGCGVNKLLSNLWGVSERVIRRWASSTRKSVCPQEDPLTDSIQRLSLLQQTCEEIEVSEKNINGFDSPKATQKRRVEERSPFSTQGEICKKSSLLDTPIDIKALKSHQADSNRKLMFCSVEDLTTNGIDESPIGATILKDFLYRIITILRFQKYWPRIIAIRKWERKKLFRKVKLEEKHFLS